MFIKSNFVKSFFCKNASSLLRYYFLRGLRGIREGCIVEEVCRRLQAMQAITW